MWLAAPAPGHLAAVVCDGVSSSVKADVASQTAANIIGGLLVDALDVEMSEWRRYGDVTPYMELCKPAFDPARLPARSVFKIRENGWRIFASQGAVPASDDFKAAYKKQGLKGLEFHEVWNDDGDPVEIPEW